MTGGDRRPVSLPHPQGAGPEKISASWVNFMRRGGSLICRLNADRPSLYCLCTSAALREPLMADTSFFSLEILKLLYPKGARGARSCTVDINIKKVYKFAAAVDGFPDSVYNKRRICQLRRERYGSQTVREHPE